MPFEPIKPTKTKLIRVEYGKKDTPVEDREYRIVTPFGPTDAVGTIKEIKERFNWTDDDFEFIEKEVKKRDEVYVLMDWDNYTLGSVVVFKSKKALKTYISSIYGDLLNDMLTTNWETGEVFVKDREDPVAVFKLTEVKE